MIDQCADKLVGHSGEVPQIPERNQLHAPFAQVHPPEVQHDRVDPAEEAARRVKRPDLLNRLLKGAKDKLLRIGIVAAEQECGGKQPVSVLGHEPFCSVFLIFPDFLPDFHSDVRLNVCIPNRVNAILPPKVHSFRDYLV